MSGVPILVEATALRVLVVGGGVVAARKARTFAEAGAVILVVALEVGREMRALSEEFDVSLHERRYGAKDIENVSLVIAATDDPDVNDTVARDARRGKRLVNVADAPEVGDFASMAVHRSGALTVGVNSGGVPAASTCVRDAIADRFDGRYADALAVLGALRRALIEAGKRGDWLALSSEILGGQFCTTVEAGVLSERIAAWR